MDINFNKVTRTTPSSGYERWVSDDHRYIIQRFSYEDVGPWHRAILVTPYYVLYHNHTRLPGRFLTLASAITAAAEHVEFLGAER